MRATDFLTGFGVGILVAALILFFVGGEALVLINKPLNKLGALIYSQDFTDIKMKVGSKTLEGIQVMYDDLNKAFSSASWGLNWGAIYLMIGGVVLAIVGILLGRKLRKVEEVGPTPTKQ